MKQQIAEKWIAALRSGEYKQTRGNLRQGDSFCCLGVLCNIHAQEHPEIAAKETNPRQYLGEFKSTPAAVREWSGLHGGFGFIYKLNNTLATLNDNGKGFVEIADIIEKYWEVL